MNQQRPAQTKVEKQPASQPAAGPEPATTPAIANSARRSWRLRAVAMVLGLLTMILVLRLLDMQVRTWYGYSPPSRVVDARNTVDDSTTWGVIVDRNGALLAADRYIYRITATPKFIPPERWPEVARILQEMAGVPAERTQSRLLQNAQGSYLVLATDVDFRSGRALLAEKERRLAAEDNTLAQVHIQARPRRFYPQGRLASQVIGFVNAERKPVLGVERYYNSFLPDNGVGLPRGGRQPKAVLPEQSLQFLSQGQGKGLVLTLDRTIQWIIEEELSEGVRFYGAESGTIIVMDPKTGAILGMANWPTFDANRYELEDPSTFNNPAVSHQYEPGSIFKVITMAAAVDAGAVHPLTVFTDTGTIVVGQRTIQNSSRTAAGRLTVADALAQSNNVVTVQVAQELGEKRFYDYTALFGFGLDTNIDISGEIPGMVKRPGHRDWSLSDLGTNSFGQGLAVTPLQMLRAVAAIANDGYLMRPYIVAARVHGNDVLLTQPTTVHRVLKPESVAMIREMMVHTVETGNLAARVPGYTVGGKSGTAEIATLGGYSADETIHSYIGFAPVDDPQFVVLVKLDKPDASISRWAAHSAAPIFKRVTYRLLDHMNIPPDEIRLAQGQR
jgi:cell division protein FtsI/penicillin-binding protein 2